MKIRDSDILLVNRGGVDYSIKAQDLKELVKNGMSDTDIMLLNRGATDYKVTGKDLDWYLNPKMPWDDWDGPIYHVKLNHPVEKLQLKMALKHYKPDGTDEQSTNTIERGEERVILCYKDFAPFAQNGIVTWDFGDLTDITADSTLADLFKDQRAFNGKLGGNWDTKGIKNMRDVFMNAYAFNQDISGWDMSSATDVSMMFLNARAFNQDLSKWCVPEIKNEDDRIDWDKGATAWEVTNKPVWGTCP